MYYEVNLIEAIMAHHNGKIGIYIKKSDDVIPSLVDDNERYNIGRLKDFIEELEQFRFIIDDTELERIQEDPKPVPEVETPEDNLEVVTPEKPRKKPGPKPGQKRNMPAKYDTEAEQKILKAWAGEKSISEVCAITGYSERVVRRCLPINENG